jgi:precorrin-2 dehydrogenase/sirohydrochlorin ferrochelatase
MRSTLRSLSQWLAQWLAQGRLRRREGDFDPAWLDEVWLVMAATDDRAFNARLAAEAGRRRRLANIVDDAELSTFQIPAIEDRARVVSGFCIGK